MATCGELENDAKSAMNEVVNAEGSLSQCDEAIWDAQKLMNRKAREVAKAKERKDSAGAEKAEEEYERAKAGRKRLIKIRENVQKNYDKHVAAWWNAFREALRKKCRWTSKNVNYAKPPNAPLAPPLWKTGTLIRKIQGALEELREEEKDRERPTLASADWSGAMGDAVDCAVEAAEGARNERENANLAMKKAIAHADKALELEEESFRADMADEIDRLIRESQAAAAQARTAADDAWDAASRADAQANRAESCAKDAEDVLADASPEEEADAESGVQMAWDAAEQAREFADLAELEASYATEVADAVTEAGPAVCEPTTRPISMIA